MYCRILSQLEVCAPDDSSRDPFLSSAWVFAGDGAAFDVPALPHPEPLYPPPSTSGTPLSSVQCSRPSPPPGGLSTRRLPPESRRHRLRTARRSWSPIPPRCIGCFRNVPARGAFSFPTGFFFGSFCHRSGELAGWGKMCGCERNHERVVCCSEGGREGGCGRVQRRKL